MAFLFNRSRPKSSAELVRQARELIPRLDEPGGIAKGAELAKILANMKLILQGTQEAETSPEQIHQLVNAIIQEDLLILLARNVHKFPFEARKDTQVIFSYTLRFKPPTAPANSDPFALHHIINNRPDVITALCRGYEHKESATPCGTVLREILKHDTVAAIILYDEPKSLPGLQGIHPDLPQTGNGVFWKFFEWIDQGVFEVSTDAFTTFRDILTKHKSIVSQYLMTNFDRFFARYNTILVQSTSYVTKRQSIKLLGEILLDRANYSVMTAYVDRGEHLKLCMNLLRDERKMVQYEGFHVFKVFVANPNKSVAVQRILINNRDRLLNFLPRFLDDRTEDEQFNDERQFLITQIQKLPAQPDDPSQKHMGSSHVSAVAS